MQVPTGPFSEVVRHRPVDVVSDADPAAPSQQSPRSTAVATPHPAPYLAIRADLAPRGRLGGVALHLTAADGARLTARLDGPLVSLHVVTPAGDRGGPGEFHTSTHRSRRHGLARLPDALALTVTGNQLTALTRERGRWVTRARYDLSDRIDTHDPAWLGGLTSSWEATAGKVRSWHAGTFGQLGLRDLRLVTHADGTPYRREGAVWFSATSAGPGFFDTAHQSLWRLDTATLELTHTGDLWFERPDRPGVYGDHAGHVVRDGDRWLVATSTWGDFGTPHGKGWVDVTLAETNADVLTGSHVLATRALALPTGDLPSVGTWDPHLLRTQDGWFVGFVSAREYFDFHPVLAGGPDLDDLTFVGAAPDRTATEGTTLWPPDDPDDPDDTPEGLRVLASDGPENRPEVRRRYPVFDRRFTEVGTLDAPYLSNIGWPTLVPPGPGQADWLMVTFDGTPAGGNLTGYGTHGDVVVLSPRTP